MNSIELYVRPIDRLEKHGIVFENCLFVDVIIDSRDMLNEELFEDTLVVFEQLRLSSVKSGNYLIFTCACGIADCGGWTGVKVIHDADWTKWIINRDGEIKYTFATAEYLAAIEKCKQAIKQMNTKKLKPDKVVFPEDWETQH